MKVTLKHNMSEAQALAHVKSLIASHRAEIEKNARIAEERWEGNTLRFSAEVQSQTINGTFTVGLQEYVLEVRLPLLLRPFEGRLKRMIEDQASSLL